MNILMVAPEPIFEPRGTPLSVVGRLKALSDVGHRIDLVTYPMGMDVSIKGVRILRIPPIFWIKKVRIGPSFEKIPLDLLLLVKTFIMLLKKDYDLIHTHEEACFWGTLFSKIFKIPHIYDMHSSLPQQFKNFQFANLKIVVSIFNMIEMWVIKNSSCVITICPELFNYVTRLGFGGKSVMIENVIDYGMIFKQIDRSDEIRESLRLQGRRVALYTGTFEPYQGLDLLLESSVGVLSEFNSVVFVLVGGRPEQIEHYKKIAVEKGVEDHFIFTGQVLPEEVNSYVRCADILLSPRMSGTNTPLKIYSYMRSGVPIVATDLITHTQVLNQDSALLTEPSPESFGKGILLLLKNKRVAARVGRNAKRVAEEKYSYSVYVEKLKKALNRAMEKICVEYAE